MNNTPKIRFHGFEDEWESQILGEIAEYSKGQGYSKNDLTEEGNPIILYGRLYTNYESTISEVDTYATPKAGSIFSTGREVIIPASGETAEDIARAAFVKQQGVILGGDLNVLTPENGIDPGFLALAITNGKTQEGLSVRAQGKTVVHIHNDDIKEVSVSIPSDQKEQTKIAQYFSKIDQLIEVQKRKCEKLVALKAACLNKMFPKRGTKVPELRFAGFTGDWEQRKFGDVGSVSMCKRIFKEETSPEGDIPFYKIGTFGGQADAYITRELYEEYRKKYSFPDEGDILLSASGTIGRIVEYKGEEAYFQDSNIVWLSHDKSVSNNFLKVLYPTLKWDGIEGSTIQRLYNDNILKTRFMMPSLEEQEKLGQYFGWLDDLITLHQRKLEKLRQFKQAMIHNMFV